MTPTRWGYEADLEDGSMPPVVSLAAFDARGGSALSASPEAKEAALMAASAAVRDWCGWHVCPRLRCRATLPSSSSALPGMGVSDVTWEDGGPAPLAPSHGVVSRRPVPVTTYEYEAGFDSEPAVEQVVCQLATNHLVATAGLREEHAGQVGATYNQTDSGVSGGIRLLASDRELLAPHRIAGVG